MIRIDYLILGYATVRVDAEHITAVSQRFLKNNIAVRIKNDGSFTVRAREIQRITDILGEIPHTVSEIKGIYGILLKLKKRYGIIAALIVTLILCVASTAVVWDVRIDGECEDADEVIAELKDAGLSPGKLWLMLDKNKIELAALKSSDSKAWRNINRRGSVAYVRVVPKEVHNTEPEKSGYASIVASHDCVIEEITVKTGIALVKPGESVRAGEVLISGVIPTELGGGYCYADGEVKGRLTDRISVFTSNEVTEKTYTDNKFGSLSINFFGKEINIFKLYGNSQENCDIIEKKHEIELLGKKIPIFCTVSHVKHYDNMKVMLSADELVALTAEKLRYELLERTACADLISIRTEGAFTDSGYEMYADMVVRESVTSIREFQLTAE